MLASDDLLLADLVVVDAIETLLTFLTTRWLPIYSSDFSSISFAPSISLLTLSLV
jgi:hypothetical protein